MKTLVAWRFLSFEPGRSVLAVGGVYASVLMIFMQLGFYSSVPQGGMIIYDAMRFDLMLTSSDYTLQGHSGQLPRRRLYQASSLPEVKLVAPLYQGSADWQNPEDGLSRAVFVMGWPPEDTVIALADVERNVNLMQRPDTVLVDTTTRPVFGPLRPGRIVEINNRAVEIGGSYTLGTGFVGIGALVTSDVNFLRMFPDRSLSEPNLGLVQLRAGAHPDAVAAKLRAMLPNDTRVFTRAEMAAQEARYWVTRTSTGLVFGFGVIVSFIVGSVILYQTLATQITRQLPQYATLKAMGYTNRDLGNIVLSLAVVTTSAGFVPAAASAVGLYALVRSITVLPVIMDITRVVLVLCICLAMSVGAGLLSLRRAQQADPVDVF